MGVDLSELSPAEEAVAATLRGWGDELDPGEKFWLMGLELPDPGRRRGNADG